MIHANFGTLGTAIRLPCVRFGNACFAVIHPGPGGPSHPAVRKTGAANTKTSDRAAGISRSPVSYSHHFIEKAEQKIDTNYLQASMERRMILCDAVLRFHSVRHHR
jgi:hypothetical protein